MTPADIQNGNGPESDHDVNKQGLWINQPGIGNCSFKRFSGASVAPLVEFSYHKTDSFLSLGIVFL